MLCPLVNLHDESPEKSRAKDSGPSPAPGFHRKGGHAAWGPARSSQIQARTFVNARRRFPGDADNGDLPRAPQLKRFGKSRFEHRHPITGIEPEIGRAS